MFERIDSKSSRQSIKEALSIKMKFWLSLPTGLNSVNIEGDVVSSEDDNVDVHIILENRKVYVVTFFTLKNIEKLMSANSGESNAYFWATDMVIIRRVTMEDITEAVSDMICRNYLVSAGDNIGTFDTVYGKVAFVENSEDNRFFEYEING